MATEVQPVADTGSAASGKPSWLLPVILAVVVGAVILGGQKKDEVLENPVVEFAVITVGVFAFAAAFRFIAVKGGWPGMAVFFGGQPSAT